MVAKRVTFPHMGTVHVPLRVLFRRLEIDTVVPPPSSDRSLALASRHSPEAVCVPYKLVLGNFLEALEKGANTLLLLSGPNNCRFGYYSILQQRVLSSLGYDFEMALPQISSRTLGNVLDVLRELSPGRPSQRQCLEAILLALSVLGSLDAVERRAQWVRAREMEPGAADACFEQACEAFASVNSLVELQHQKAAALARLAGIPVDIQRWPLRVSLVGEIYLVHEPFINRNLERELGRMGVEVRRAEQLSQWLVLSPALILEGVGLGHEARIARAARPYLEYLHGETIGQTVRAHREAFDGVIHLAPFTCTPEVVNQNVLSRLRRDIDIPVLSLILDEQTSSTGMVTRLEAFVDLLERRRRRARSA